MPLKKGSSGATISQNISEFHTGPTYAHTAAKFGADRARKQAIAVALHSARQSKGKAFGGPNLNMENMLMRGSSYGLRHEGMIGGSTPGRVDNRQMNVPSGSYVIPSDIPSALGQGNSSAGGDILKRMFNSGPYGMPPMRGAGRSGMSLAPRLNLRAQSPKMPKFATGGADNNVEIVAASGEYIIPPEVVTDLGHGSLKAGHKVLDALVLKIRKEHIKTLSKLPPPKK